MRTVMWAALLSGAAMVHGVVTAQQAPAPAATPARTASAAADNPAEQIIVTGSRIPRPSFDKDQPTVTVTAADIDRRSFTTVAQALNQTPGFGVADSSLVGSQGNGFGVGQAFINLYDLGSNRTLTLINGRRFVGANPASIFSSADAGVQVDLNTIPTALLDRVEIVGIGGAPIYGSDAIAGTVNIILKKNYTGLDVSAQAGISERGDLPNYRFRALGGFSFGPDQRGHFTIGADYITQSGLLGTERAAIRAQTGFISPTAEFPGRRLGASQVLVGDQRTFLGTEGGNPYFIDRGTIGVTRSIVDPATGGFVRFGQNGDLVPFNTGIRTNDATTFIGGDGLNFDKITNLSVDSDRINVAAFLDYKLTDNIRVFGEAWYSNNRAKNLADQPVYNTAFFRQADAGAFDVNGNYIFKLNNPFLTDQARGIIRQNLINQELYTGDDATSVFYLGRANTDLVSGVSTLNQNLYRFVGGVTGDFRMFNQNFTWEVSLNHGRTSSVARSPTLVEPNLRRALNVTRDANGNIVCAPFNPDPNDPTAPPNLPQYNGTISTTCAPLNLFGQGAPSQAARDYVTTNARINSITTQRDFLATVAGNLFELPGGKVGVSLGYENRREGSKFFPDAFYTGALGRSVPFEAVSGSYTTNEGFGEIRVPLVSRDMGLRFIDTLEANFAGRYVDNSIAGGAFTWTAGGRFAPVRDISFRGNFTHSIRAPAVTELFAADQPAFDGGFDPCDRENVGGGPNPAVRLANCTAGIFGQDPTTFSSIINSVTVPITVIGSRLLKNEEADSWTVGGVFEPRFVPGFSMAVDYISISLKKTIVASSARDVLTGCYDSPSYPNNFYCGLITRDATQGDNLGQVLKLREPFINQGGLTRRLLQVVADYRLDLPRDLGKLTLGGSYVHYIKAYQVISADSGPTNTRGNIGTPTDQATIRATYDKGPASWYNEVRIVGPSRFDASEAPGTRDVPSVPMFTVWNSSLKLAVNKRAYFQVGVDNVLDVAVPYPGSGNATQNIYTEGLFGRSYTAQFGVSF